MLEQSNTIESFPHSSEWPFRSLQLDNIRNWILSAAPAASVGLGATFSPGHWSVVHSSGDQSLLCVWECEEVGFWDHICWSCPWRPCWGPCQTCLSTLGSFRMGHQKYKSFPRPNHSGAELACSLPSARHTSGRLRTLTSSRFLATFAVTSAGWQQLQSLRRPNDPLLVSPC